MGRDSTSMLDLVVMAANRAGFEPRTDLHSMDFQVILAAVAEGLGVTLVPPLALVGCRPEGIDIQPPADAQLHRRIHAAIRRGSGGNPAIAVALSALKRCAEGLEPRLAEATAVANAEAGRRPTTGAEAQIRELTELGVRRLGKHCPPDSIAP